MMMRKKRLRFNANWDTILLKEKNPAMSTSSNTMNESQTSFEDALQNFVEKYQTMNGRRLQDLHEIH